MNTFKNFLDKKNQIKFDFKPGDKICINFKNVDEKIRKKSYNFEGIIISIKNNGISSTCTVRKISFGEGIEKTFFTNSPNINSIKLIKNATYSKSKLYFLRKKKI